MEDLTKNELEELQQKHRKEKKELQGNVYSFTEKYLVLIYLL